MASQKPLFLFIFLFLSGWVQIQVVYGQTQSVNNNIPKKKLFVFGDSYADTGNSRKSISGSWKYPYGLTFPGKPAGRFSDGRVLTDYLAKYLGVKSPIAYRWRKVVPQQLKYGVNFAYGGTGVFNTLVMAPNMTTQIDFFQQLIKESVYNATDLSSSVALVSLAGNDYGAYLATNGSMEGFPSFIQGVVKQLSYNIKRIHNFGVKKIAVTGLEPIGCLPESTAEFSYQQCNANLNSLVGLHNSLLKASLSKLPQQAYDTSSTFLYLNLYDNFMSVLQSPSNKFKKPHRPCCVGLSSEYSCGSVDNKGEKKYYVCGDPKSTFFWDSVHPTEAGWRAVYDQLLMTCNLQKLEF